MRYRVAFAKRVQSDGDESSMRPSAELDLNLSDGVVAEKVFVEQLETEAQHSQEVLDEDDAFLGSAVPEVWEYEIVDGRCAEFEDAIQKSDLVLEYDVVDNTVTGADEATGAPLGQGGIYPPDGGSNAGGLSRGRSSQHDGLGPEGAGGIDDLTVVSGNDPRLGLTNHGKKPAQDWAANTGPTRNPERGGGTETPSDDTSTLAPNKPRKRR
jgi:hypothetical protein